MRIAALSVDNGVIYVANEVGEIFRREYTAPERFAWIKVCAFEEPRGEQPQLKQKRQRKASSEPPA